MCFKTPGGEGGEDGRVSIGTLGRGPRLHQQQRRGQGSSSSRGGRAPSSSSSEPARGTWYVVDGLSCRLLGEQAGHGRLLAAGC